MPVRVFVGLLPSLLVRELGCMVAILVSPPSCLGEFGTWLTIFSKITGSVPAT